MAPSITTVVQINNWRSLMSEQINQIALLAAKDPYYREELIHGQETMILRTASLACHHYVTKNDDEWSVALYAFSRAIDSYDEEKGSFLPFAQMLIRRDLVDYFRSQKRTAQEISVAPHILEGNGEPGEDSENIYLTVARTSQQSADSSLKDEIISANEMLQQYGFRFFDLTESSPQQDKTRKECATAIRYMLTHTDLCEQMKKKHKIPIKELALGSGVSRKTIDRYRKYLIMAVLILEGDYPHIAGYLKFVREEASV